MKKRAVINITQEAKSQMDDIKSEGQSYDGIIRELVKFWKTRKSTGRGEERQKRY